MVARGSERSGTPPFADRGFYRRLSRIGEQRGIRVIIFDPLRTNWRTGCITGYQYNSARRRWYKVHRPIPPIIFDRCFYSGKSQYLRYQAAINRLRRVRSVYRIIRGLSGKWQVQQMLANDDKLRPYLPETSVLTDLRQVSEWLQLGRACILKPNAGSHGKQIIRIDGKDSRIYEVTGRDMMNREIRAEFDSLAQLLLWLRRFIGSRKFLLQEALELQTEAGQSFDVRSLMQKSGDGKWHLTGMAVRLGKPGSLTANIHGGGSSSPLEPFLAAHYETTEVEEIMRELTELSYQIPMQLERETGELLELGIDFGIDRRAQVWILEVNSKPGRSVFNLLHDTARSKASISNLIHYADYLFDRQIGGLTI